MGEKTGGTRFRGIVYDPLPSQARFHSSQARFKGFSGPVGSGKSEALCQEAIRLSYCNPGRTGLIGAPTYPMLRDATVASLIGALERNQIPYEHRKAESVLVVGEMSSKILLRSVDNFERLRGTNLAWFGVDELTYVPKEAWLRLEARLRDPKASVLRGFAVWTPKGFDWVYERFIRNPVEGYEAIIAQAFENRHLLDHVPDYYERLRSSYDPALYEQEVRGEYLNLNAGAVYRSFSRDRNVKRLDTEQNWPLFWALDFNVDPMCSLVVQMAGTETRVLDEIVLSGASTHEACEEFCRRFPRHRAGIVIYGDASGSRRQTAGTTDYQIVRECLRTADYQHVSFRVPAKNPPVRDRVNLTNSMLYSADEQIRLFVDPRCKALIRDFEEVTYKPDSRVVDKDRDPKLTHLSDALGYLIWQECRPRSEFGYQPRPLF